MLPALNLKTSDLSGHVYKRFGDDWDEVMDQSGRAVRTQLTSLNTAMAAGAEPMGDANWECTSFNPGLDDNRVFRQDDFSPYDRIWNPINANYAPWQYGPYKYLTKLYTNPDAPEDATMMYNYYPPNTRENVFNLNGRDAMHHGTFDVSDMEINVRSDGPIKVEWFTFPATMAAVRFNVEPIDVDGPPPMGALAQVDQYREEVGYLMDPVTQTRVTAGKITYIAVVAIDLISGSKNMRFCGSLLYKDDVAPGMTTLHRIAVPRLLTTCPYNNIGKEFAEAPGSQTQRRYVREQYRSDQLGSDSTA